MNYVDAGYAIAFGTVFVYAVSLVQRRRRLERALHLSEQPTDGAAPGDRP